jgi:hypothetical protein
MPPPDDQLPAIIEPAALPTPAPADAYIVPALITAAGGDRAAWRYVEFFAANINNDHTRRAYARACSRFFAWCENRGVSLTAIRPFDVGAWVKELQEKHAAPGVKQQLAAVPCCSTGSSRARSYRRPPRAAPPDSWRSLRSARVSLCAT